MRKQPSVPMSFACWSGSSDKSSLLTSFASSAWALSSSKGASTFSSLGNPLALSHVICREECFVHRLRVHLRLIRPNSEASQGEMGFVGLQPQAQLKAVQVHTGMPGLKLASGLRVM